MSQFSRHSRLFGLDRLPVDAYISLYTVADTEHFPSGLAHTRKTPLRYLCTLLATGADKRPEGLNFTGAGKGIRTLDPRIGKAVKYQLAHARGLLLNGALGYSSFNLRRRFKTSMYSQISVTRSPKAQNHSYSAGSP